MAYLSCKAGVVNVRLPCNLSSDGGKIAFALELRACARGILGRMLVDGGVEFLELLLELAPLVVLPLEDWGVRDSVPIFPHNVEKIRFKVPLLMRLHTQ